MVAKLSLSPSGKDFGVQALSSKGKLCNNILPGVKDDRCMVEFMRNVLCDHVGL